MEPTVPDLAPVNDLRDVLHHVHDRAANLAKSAADIADNDPHALLLSRAAALESALVAAGDDGAAQQAAAAKWSAAAKPSVADLERLLEFAVEHQHISAAAAVVRLLAALAGLFDPHHR